MILDDLLNTWRGIIEEELEQQYDESKLKVFDITQPLLNLYEAVKDLCEVAAASKLPYTKQQKLG